MDLSLGPMTRALDDHDRAVFAERLRSDVAAGHRARPPGATLRAAELRAMLDVLRADPFDANALSAQLQTQQARATTWAQAGQAALIERLEAMTSSQRTAFADRLESEFESREHLPRRRR